jgi:hypothetical protein
MHQETALNSSRQEFYFSKASLFVEPYHDQGPQNTFDDFSYDSMQRQGSLKEFTPS